jgi:hypothetical protein
MWDHLERNKKDFFNFGFGLELAPGLEEQAYQTYRRKACD